jgi:hypothetical protein
MGEPFKAACPAAKWNCPGRRENSRQARIGSDQLGDRSGDVAFRLDNIQH